MKLYLGNLPFKITEEDLLDWFKEQGIAVDTITVMRDRFSNEPRGFGFAEIHDDAAAKRAIESCHGQAMSGRVLVVNEAKPLPKAPFSERGPRKERY